MIRKCRMYKFFLESINADRRVNEYNLLLERKS